MKKINLRKLFKKKNQKDLGTSSVVWLAPALRDWRIIVSVFAVGLISLSLFSWRIYLSDKIAGGYLAPEIDSSNILVKSIDKDRLQKNLLILETKQADALKYQMTIKPIDPAL